MFGAKAMSKISPLLHLHNENYSFQRMSYNKRFLFKFYFITFKMAENFENFPYKSMLMRKIDFVIFLREGKGVNRNERKKSKKSGKKFGGRLAVGR